MRESPLQLRLLGPLELVREGMIVTLPPSRTARALLGYLAATARPHGRDHLCDLFWDGPADPRASLRSALSRLRPLLDDDGEVRLVADAVRIAFVPGSAFVDLAAAQAAAADADADADIDTLSAAVERFRGEFLEGLDLSRCHRFDLWCTTERSNTRRLHASLLTALVQRLERDPERALDHARRRLQLDPYDDRHHLDVMRLLAELGRFAEAAEQYETCCRLLREERGAQPSPELDALRRKILPLSLPPRLHSPATASPGLAARGETGVATPKLAPLIGRDRECNTLRHLVASAAAGGDMPVLLVTGEPGIGKTRLLDELASMVREAGGESLAGRAFEAEMIRPYGAWIDALRAIPQDAIPFALRADLSPILPELGHVPDATAGRVRLFDAVARLLVERASNRCPLAILLDDIQWLDDASAALVHFLARTPVAGLLMACASRGAGVHDNPAASRLPRALRRDCEIVHLGLSPLDAADTAELIRTRCQAIAAPGIFERSGGNPLYALEIVRASSDARESIASHSISELIDDRLDLLDVDARDLLPWVAALGRAFSVSTLVRLVAKPDAMLLPAVGELERRGVLAPAGSGYDFVHDIVREVAYGQLSEPRRRLIHGRIAAVLDEMDGPDHELAGEVAHHAAIGGDRALVARACLAAARRALMMSAPDEAAALTTRGEQHLDGLPPDVRLPLQLELLSLSVYPGMKEHRVPDVERRLARAIAEARHAGLRAQVHRGFQLVADVHYLDGDFGGALDRSLRAQEAGRTADPATVVRAIGDTARCLGILDRDMPRAGRLAREAESLAEGVAYEGHELPQALGYVHHHAGALDDAVECFELAAHRAHAEHARWFECACLARLVMIELERDRPTRALARSKECVVAARRLDEGSDLPFAEALRAVARLRLDPSRSRKPLDRALARLRRADSRWMIAYVQNLAGRSELDADQIEAGLQRVKEALESAEVAHRRNEVAVARSHLARLALSANDGRGALAQLEALRKEVADADALSARARAAVDRAEQAVQRQAPHPSTKDNVRANPGP
ncbi:MAG TPA: AAA family ATPase [Gemmatimonadaceae bacterium]|nr:AAA family ATPase [Gemmatimonadaceae bacterium]